MSSGPRGVEAAVELAGDVALEAAADFGIGLAFCAAPGDLGPGLLARAPASQEDVVQGAVEVAVAAAVEPVTDDAAATGGDRAGAGERGVGGIVAAAARVGPGHDRWCGADRAHAAFGQQLRRQVGDQLGEVALVIGEFLVDPADGESEAAGLGAPDGLFAGLVLTAAAAGDGSEPVRRQGAAGQRSVGRIRTYDTGFRKFFHPRNPKIRITRKLLTKVLTVREFVKSWHSSESIRVCVVCAPSCGMGAERELIMTRKSNTAGRSATRFPSKGG